mgnify:CR=1 FL=1
MAETTTITKPAPIIEGALTSFLETLKKLQPGTIPAGGFTGIDTEKFKPQSHLNHNYKLMQEKQRKV